MSRCISGRSAALAVAILASSLGFMDGTVVSIAVPAIRRDLAASLAAIQWVSNGYTLVVAAFILAGGALGDRLGVRNVLNAGIALFTVSSLLCALAPSAEMLILARVAQGFGASAMIPASLALLAKTFSGAERGKAIGTWAASSSVAAAAGPLLAGFMVGPLGWRSVFFVNLPLAGLALAVSVALVPRDPPSGPARALDIPGALLAAAGLGALALGLTLAGDARPPAPGSPLLWCAGGAVCLAAFLAREVLAKAPMLPLALFRSRIFAAANALTFFLYAALGGLMFYLPQALIAGHHAGAARAAVVFLPFPVMMGLLSRWSGALADRIGARVPLTAGASLAALGFAGLGWAVNSPHVWPGVLAAMVVVSAGFGIAVSPLSTVVMQSAGAERAGAASGVNNAVSRVAGLLAVATFGLAAVAAHRHAAAAAGLPDISRLVVFGGGEANLPPQLDALRVLADRLAFGAIAAASALCAFVAALCAAIFMPDKRPIAP